GGGGRGGAGGPPATRIRSPQRRGGRCWPRGSSAMAWVKQGRYYQTCRRVRGRVVSTYLGRGPLVEMLAAEDEEARAERERLRREARDRERAEREQLAAEAALGRTLNLLVATCLEGLGYRRHHPGRWRRPRMPTSL